MRKLKIAIILYVLLDLYFGGHNGGFLPLSLSAAAQSTFTILPPGGLGVSCNAVTASTSTNPGLTGGCTAFAWVSGLPSVYTWQVITTGSPSGLAVNLMGSLDGSTWTQVDTSSSAGSRSVSTIAYRFVGCVPATLSGGTSPTVTCQISGAIGVNGSPTFTTGTTLTVTGLAAEIVCTNTCTITFPIPALNAQYCVRNDDNVATVITLAAISGVQFENTARTSYKTANTSLASAGAATDQICVGYRDATHYIVWSYTGTWS